VKPHERQGQFTFIPQANNTTCAVTSFDRYSPCTDGGVVHPGTRVGTCNFIPGVAAPIGPMPPAKKQ